MRSALLLLPAGLLLLAACTESGITNVNFLPAEPVGMLYFGEAISQTSDSARWPGRCCFPMKNGETLKISIMDSIGFIGGLKVVSLEELGDPSHYEAEIEVHRTWPNNEWKIIENSSHLYFIFRRGEWPPASP